MCKNDPTVHRRTQEPLPLILLDNLIGVADDPKIAEKAESNTTIAPPFSHTKFCFVVSEHCVNLLLLFHTHNAFFLGSRLATRSFLFPNGGFENVFCMF